jgi:hypothetical protein
MIMWIFKVAFGIQDWDSIARDQSLLQGQEGILHADLIIQAALCGDFFRFNRISLMDF